MTDSGVRIPSDILDQVNEIKLEQKYDFAFFKVENDSIVLIDKFPKLDNDLQARSSDKSREENWKQRVYPTFFNQLCEYKDPCWVVLDFRAILEDGRKITKVMLIGWSPDKCPVKQRMIFAATHKKLADRFNIAKRIEAHTPADVSYEEIFAKASS